MDFGRGGRLDLLLSLEFNLISLSTILSDLRSGALGDTSETPSRLLKSNPNELERGEQQASCGIKTIVERKII